MGSCGEEPGSFPRCECFNALARACKLFNFFLPRNPPNGCILAGLTQFPFPSAEAAVFVIKNPSWPVPAQLSRCDAGVPLCSSLFLRSVLELFFPLFASHNMDNVCFIFLVFVSLPLFSCPLPASLQTVPSRDLSVVPTLYLVLAACSKRQNWGGQ